jgi:hypothetical protein
MFWQQVFIKLKDTFRASLMSKGSPHKD